VVGEREVLIAAKQMLDFKGISILEDSGAVSYYHLLLDTHELLISNGAITESFFIGPVAMASISTEARMEIISLFPNLTSEEPSNIMPSVRRIVSGPVARTIVARALRNTKPLVEPREYVDA
jgi:hypothetical protein